MDFLIVFLGGGIGSALRHGANLLAARSVGVHYPFGTLCINVLGSVLMGAVVALAASRLGLAENTRLLLATGVLGGFTTFSAFSLEVAMLHTRGESAAAAAYALASVVLGVAGLFAGMAAVRWATA